MENFDWTALVSILLGGVAIVASGFWLKAKGKLAQIAALVKEAYEVVAAINAALADDKISKEEVEGLKKELGDVKDAFFALIGK